MILILSESTDQSTNYVIQWLIHFGKPFVRINAGDEVTLVKASIHNNQIELRVKNAKLLLNDISAYWYRRGDFSFSENDVSIQHNDKLEQYIGKYLDREHFEIKSLLHHQLKKLPGIGAIHNNNLNKLITLQRVAAAGLKIPSSYILSTKEELQALFDSHEGLITKSIGDIPNFLDDSIYGYGRTELITQNDIDELPEQFTPMFVQEEIPKAFELRVFFLNGKFYSGAIFSQQSEAAKVDFRNGAGAKGLRIVPYILPQEIRDRLKHLLLEMKLNACSVDMLVSERHEYFFLEINPVGQFGFISAPCNYNLEKEVAMAITQCYGTTEN